MAKFNHNIATFQSGEVSPKFYGRSDVTQFNQGCKSLLNCMVLPQGGAQSRPGSQYKTTLQANTSTAIRNIPFVAASGTRFNIIMKAGNVTTWRAIDLTTPGSSFSLATFFDAETVWTEAQINGAHYAQSGDVMIITHGDKAPLTIRYDGIGFNTGVWWQGFPGPLTTDENLKRHAFGDLEILNVNNRGTLTASVAAGPGTVTSSAGIFVAAHVGAVFRLTSASVTGAIVITGYTNATTATYAIFSGLNVPVVAVGTAAGTSWEEEAWSAARGYPKACAFFEGRSYYAGSKSYPNRVWMSKTGNIVHLMYRPTEQDTAFSTYTADNSRAWSFDIAATEYSTIIGLSPGKTLAIFTNGREYIAKGISDILGQKSFDVKAATAFGSSPIQAVRINNQAMFVQRSGKRIRNLTFSFEEDDYKSQDMTSLAEHIVRTHYKSLAVKSEHTSPAVNVAFTQIALQSSPDNRLWALDTHGGLMSCTMSLDTNVLAWSPHRLGGLFGSNPPSVKSIAICPSADNTRDELWLVVHRTLNGTDVTTLEKVGGYFEGDSLDEGYNDIDRYPIFLDCAGYDNIYGTAIPPSTGWIFPHLANETVHAIGDGSYLGTVTANGSGLVTLPRPVSSVIVGYYHERVIQPLGIEVGSPTGSSQGLTKMADTITVRFVRTVNAKYGKSDVDTLYTMNFIGAGALVGAAPNLFTGDKKELLGGFSRELSPIVKQDLPYPFEVACIILNGMSYD